jgi:hypothetical protein
VITGDAIPALPAPTVPPLKPIPSPRLLSPLVPLRSMAIPALFEKLFWLMRCCVAGVFVAPSSRTTRTPGPKPFWIRL